ncbi:MAG: GAF domain-containing protein, partial [Halothece sp.]
MADQNHCQLLPEALDRETLLNRITSKIRQTSELPEILMTAVQEIGAFLKTERVKIYYFHPDHSGEVIAESIQDSHLPSLLGLRFPAEDIPPRAREVFLKTHARVIVDVVSGQKTVEKADCGAIAKAGSFDGDIDYGPVDPCHQEYLKAMGVSFSIVFPIVLENQLWGLLVCHHSVPVCISQRQMQIVQLLVDQISIAIAQSQLLQRATEQAKQEAVLHKISSLLYSSSSFDLIQQTVLEEISEALNANGGRLYLKPLQNHSTSQLYTHGVQPPLFRLEQ